MKLTDVNTGLYFFDVVSLDNGFEPHQQTFDYYDDLMYFIKIAKIFRLANEEEINQFEIIKNTDKYNL